MSATEGVFSEPRLLCVKRIERGPGRRSLQARCSVSRTVVGRQGFPKRRGHQRSRPLECCVQRACPRPAICSLEEPWLQKVLGVRVLSVTFLEPVEGS